MCGFVGILLNDFGARPEQRSHVEQKIRNMAGQLAHRGPDSSGAICGPAIAMAHQRLAILDLSVAGAQPMSAPDGEIHLVYNGECFNYMELKSRLQACKVRFHSESDTEVLLQTYRHWGLQGLNELQGMFAFALWDEHERTLVLRRDRLGIKPLYFGLSQLGLAFASEINALRAAGDVDATLNRQAFHEYMWFGNSFEDRTFLCGVSSLQPGHELVVGPLWQKEGIPKQRPWWRVEEWLSAGDLEDQQEIALQLRGRIDLAVQRQLVSDVPVGVLLSGGIDSATITASAAIGSDKEITAYSCGFDYEVIPSAHAAASIIADHLGVSHRTLHVTGYGLESVIEKLVRVHGEPFADAANIAIYLMAQQIKEFASVVLQGDGGDELFAGYRRYSLLSSKLTGHRGLIRLIAKGTSRGQHIHRFHRIMAALAEADSGQRMALLLTMETLRAAPEKMFTGGAKSDLFDGTDPFLAYARAAYRFQDQSPVKQMLLTDLTLQLPSQFLTKVDRGSMAAGIEARVPFLDEGVASFAVGLPEKVLASASSNKVILRNSQRERLPPSVVRARKIGFGVPYWEWLRGPLHSYARARLLDENFLSEFSLSRPTVEALLAEHRERKANHGFRLWKLLNLSVWSQDSWNA